MIISKNGIDLTDRVGGQNYKTFYQQFSDMVNMKQLTDKKTGFNLVKTLWHKAIDEKTFLSLMPQIKVSVFEGAYKTAIASGMEEEMAQAYAAKITKTSEGITTETGRSNTTKETLGSIIFAPSYREGLVNVFYEGSKAWSTEFKNPEYQRSRSFMAGLVVMYAIYNYINYKLNGNFMWDNPPGRELAIKLKLPNDDIAYFDLGPGLLTVPRNLIVAGFSLAKGDIATAEQKAASILSMGLQTTVQVVANKDYFGNPIYGKTDDGPTTIKKIATYVGLSVSHPYVSQIYKYISGNQPLYWSLINMVELPVKMTNLTKEQTSAYYDALNKKAKEQAQARQKLMPTYHKLQDLKANGQKDEADKLYYELSKEDKAVYDSIKRSELLKDTNKRKAQMQVVYDNLQKMKDEGRFEEASTIYNSLSAQDQHAYDLIKNKASK